MNEINEIKIPKGVDRIAVKQHDDKIVIKFIPGKPKFKEGDFVYEDGRIMIVKNYPNSYYALIYPKLDMEPVYNKRYAPTGPLSSLSFRYATEEEEQLLIDAMKADGKWWNAEKKCIEDIPQTKFKVGDKVRIKDGISSKTHKGSFPSFLGEMNIFIGKELTVEGYRDGFVVISENYYKYFFAEDWLEPWSDKPKNGDLVIAWNNDMSLAVIGFKINATPMQACKHVLNNNNSYKYAIKFESKEQFEKVLRGEI